MSILRRPPREVCTVWPDPLELSEMPDLEWTAPGQAGWLPWEPREVDAPAAPPRAPVRTRRRPLVIVVLAGVSAAAAALLSFSVLERRAPRARPAGGPGRPGSARVTRSPATSVAATGAGGWWKPTPIAVRQSRGGRRGTGANRASWGRVTTRPRAAHSVAPMAAPIPAPAARAPVAPSPLPAPAAPAPASPATPAATAVPAAREFAFETGS